ncbi:hypothetical protein E4U43_006347, partial [Claviceps pusilla]
HLKASRLVISAAYSSPLGQVYDILVRIAAFISFMADKDLLRSVRKAPRPANAMPHFLFNLMSFARQPQVRSDRVPGV